jgi:hypothetical protein
MPPLGLSDVVSLTNDDPLPKERQLEKKNSDPERESAIDSDGVDVDAKDLSDAQNLATRVISVEDDPSLNPWTFRTLFIGIGLSTFGGVLGMSYNLNTH